MQSPVLTYGLDDHGIDLVGAELELVAREGVSESEGHETHVLLGDSQKTGGLLAQSTVQLADGGVGHALEVEGVLGKRSVSQPRNRAVYQS